MGLLDLIFPKRCVACGRFGSYLCEKDEKKITGAKCFCPMCLKAAIGGTTHPKCKGKLSLDGLICLFDYSTPVKEIIHELKYRFVRDLQEVVRAQVKKSKRLDSLDLSSFTLIPIPLSSSRKNWRGFNQTEILGKLVAQKLKIPFASDILARTKDTKSQVKLPRKERIRQTKGVFQVADPKKALKKNFLVFDDVWTTGATLKEATAVLKRKGAVRVWGLALASSH